SRPAAGGSAKPVSCASLRARAHRVARGNGAGGVQAVWPDAVRAAQAPRGTCGRRAHADADRRAIPWWLHCRRPWSRIRSDGADRGDRLDAHAARHERRHASPLTSHLLHPLTNCYPSEIIETPSAQTIRACLPTFDGETVCAKALSVTVLSGSSL